jgi:hypothetical protein
VQTADLGIFQDFYKEFCHEFTTPHLNYCVQNLETPVQIEECLGAINSHSASVIRISHAEAQILPNLCIASKLKSMMNDRIYKGRWPS